MVTHGAEPAFTFLGADAAAGVFFRNAVPLHEPLHPFLFGRTDRHGGVAELRKAKLSYNPHHLTEKCWACLLEDGYDY